jgi:hypothetical protein
MSDAREKHAVRTRCIDENFLGMDFWRLDCDMVFEVEQMKAGPLSKTAKTTATAGFLLMDGHVTQCRLAPPHRGALALQLKR